MKQLDGIEGNPQYMQTAGRQPYIDEHGNTAWSEPVRTPEGVEYYAPTGETIARRRNDLRKNTVNKNIKEMLGFYNLDNKRLSEITGHTEGSIKSMLAPGKEPPRWLKLSLYMWEHNKFCGYIE